MTHWISFYWLSCQKNCLIHSLPPWYDVFASCHFLWSISGMRVPFHAPHPNLAAGDSSICVITHRVSDGVHWRRVFPAFSWCLILMRLKMVACWTQLLSSLKTCSSCIHYIFVSGDKTVYFILHFNKGPLRTVIRRDSGCWTSRIRVKHKQHYTSPTIKS